MDRRRAVSGKPAKDIIDEEIQQLEQKYKVFSVTKETKFTNFPLSNKTLKGLSEAKYVNPTDIQREGILPALQGKDVVGAAITGSGKTLAFLIPVLERLYANKWSRTDGTGAVIISPTRELAYQIFETMKKIGKYHEFSAGLIIGGKNLKFERRRMDQCNILICTPGRLLQHMDENPLFNATTMQILVLDEADRCLDMGFEKTLNAIIENFPPERQTLLFSATQTRSVKDLARLNLHDPVYIGQNKEDETNAIPDLLQQSYVVVALEDKITILWSFIKNHLKQKIIVFLSSCKQVKYVYEMFCKLRPGTSLLALYGTLHQDRRIAIYNEFVRKSNVVLFATDIASRGLDFPVVNWVLQMDCPEDVTQYIHRAGRSARNKKPGESLLFLLPTEENGMIADLHKKNIITKKIRIDPKKLFSPRAKMEGLLAQNTELKASAQRAFISYIKSVFLMKNKQIFNVLKLDFDAFAKSLGLIITPRVRFLERILKKQQQQQQQQPANDDDSDTADTETEIKLKAPDSDTESDDDFLKIKRANHEIIANESDAEELLPIPKKDKVITKAAVAKKAINKKLQINAKLKFDEDGKEVIDNRKQMQSNLAKEYEKVSETVGGIDIKLAKKLMTEEDKYDKQRFRDLVKQRHKKLKVKLKKRENENDDDDDDDDISDDEAAEVDENNETANITAKDTSSSDESDDDISTGFNENAEIENIEDLVDSYEHDDYGVDDVPAKKKRKMTAALTLDDAETIAAQLIANS